MNFFPSLALPPFVVAGIVAVALTACGGAENHASHFTGTWMGTTAMTASGGSTTEKSIPLNITSPEDNVLELGNFCVDGSGPSAVAISDVEFEVQPFECSPVPTDACEATVYKVTSGKGTLSGGKLTVVLEGVVTGCDPDVAYEGTFTGENMFTRRSF